MMRGSRPSPPFPVRPGPFLSVLAALAWLAVAHGGRAQDWPQWRGPLWCGASSATNGAGAAASAAPSVRWRTDIDCFGASTPVVVGDRLYTTGEEDRGHGLRVVCLDPADGRVRWQRPLGSGRAAIQNAMATPSPAADARGVWALFGNGRLVAFDPDGNERWRRDLEADFGPVAPQFGYSSSPLLLGDRLIVAVLREAPGSAEPTPGAPATNAWLLALEAATGRTLWRAPRPTAARGESQDAYTSPVPLPAGGGADGFLTLGGQALAAHDAATGAERWRWDGYAAPRKSAERAVASPVPAEDGLIVVCAPRHGSVFAVAPPPAGAGTPRVTWVHRATGADASTPLCYRGIVYVAHDVRREVTALDARTGRRLWAQRLGEGAPLRASPLGAAGCVFCLDEDGTLIVLAAGAEFKELARLPLDGAECRASPVAAHDLVFVRVDTEILALDPSPSAAPSPRLP